MKISLVICLVLALIGCDQKQDIKTGSAPWGRSQIIVNTEMYEGHKLIVGTSAYGVAILHHPDCPCQVNK